MYTIPVMVVLAQGVTADLATKWPRSLGPRRRGENQGNRPRAA